MLDHLTVLGEGASRRKARPRYIAKDTDALMIKRRLYDANDFRVVCTGAETSIQYSTYCSP